MLIYILQIDLLTIVLIPFVQNPDYDPVLSIRVSKNNNSYHFIYLFIFCIKYLVLKLIILIIIFNKSSNIK